MRNLLIAGCVAVLVAHSMPARAWDDEGHMIVAAAAYDQLTPATKARVAELLALNEYPTNGRNNLPKSQAAKATFIMAATAPDAIKKSIYHYKNDGEDPSKAPQPAANIGFSDRYEHRYWHYIDFPFSPDGTPLAQPPAVNAEERIALFRHTIASNAPDALKAYDLVWLLHLVGDVHQPLHATSRFTADAPHGDEGGNKVKLCDKPHCRAELHAFWDDVLGHSENVSAAVRAADALPTPDAAKAVDSNEADWVQESFEAAKKYAYAPPIGDGLGPYKLTLAYKARAKKVARERVALAAARLANMLNTELK